MLDNSKCWWIKKRGGAVVLATLSEMYDNTSESQQAVPDTQEMNPLKLKTKQQQADKVQVENISRDDEEDEEEKISFIDEHFEVIAYIAIAILAAFLLPLSYWISLKIYNYFS